MKPKYQAVRNIWRRRHGEVNFNHICDIFYLYRFKTSIKTKSALFFVWSVKAESAVLLIKYPDKISARGAFSVIFFLKYQDKVNIKTESWVLLYQHSTGEFMLQCHFLSEWRRSRHYIKNASLQKYQSSKNFLLVKQNGRGYHQYMSISLIHIHSIEINLYLILTISWLKKKHILSGAWMYINS